MKKSLLTLSLASLSFSVFAADSYTVDPRHTFPSFEISHMGFSIQRGRFDHTSGKIVLDPKAANGGSVKVSIDTASISTGLAELEEHLRGKDFFDAKTYPQIEFSSTQLNYAGDELKSVDGNLRLHGIAKPVHLTVDHFHCGLNPISAKSVCGANATTSIQRSEFGVDKYVPMVGDEVKIAIQIEAVKD